MKSKYCVLLLLALNILTACTGKKVDKMEGEQSKVEIKQTFFGTTLEGDSIDLYTLSNSRGMSIEIITYGGIITKWTAPNRDGVYENVVLGYDSLSQYQKSSPYFGAIVGRYGNRIAKGRFTLDGKEYVLAINNDPNHLHGGIQGFDKVPWQARVESNLDEVSLVLTHTSPDGDEGYPGELSTMVTYTLDNENTLKVAYEARTDKKTVVNLTQHSYFNLSGDFSKKVLDHEISIAAEHYLPVDKGLIPTGELQSVKNSPFDFTSPKKLGLEINASDPQLEIGGGYDHCWVFTDKSSDMKLVASAYDPGSGRYLEVSTNEPALQFYTGNFLDGSLPMRGGGSYEQRTGFCLETQHYPDSPNQSEFPSTVLEPGNLYKSETRFKFSSK